MPWDANHKSATKQRILESAAYLFTQESFDDVSIDDIMKAAKLTRGAFYAHFKTKADLYKQSIPVAAQQAYKQLTQGCGNSTREIRNRYLRQTMSGSDAVLCPMASLVSDIRHRDPTIQQAYTQVFKGFVKQLADLTDSNENDAFRQAAMLIGAVALSQTLSDDDLKESLLTACLDDAMLS